MEHRGDLSKMTYYDFKLNEVRLLLLSLLNHHYLTDPIGQRSL